MAQYRLQVLIDLRERAKVEKEEALAQTKKMLQMEQQKLEDLRKQLQDMCESRDQKHQEFMEKTQSGEIGINGYLQAERYLKRVDEQIVEFEETEIKEQEKRIVFAEQEVEWAFEEMLAAMQEFKALEKHRENWAAEVKKERKKKEADNQEEIATTIFLFKDK